MSSCICMRRSLSATLNRGRAVYSHQNSFGIQAVLNRKSSTNARKHKEEEVSSQDIAKYKKIYNHIDKERDGIKVCDFLQIVRESGLTATEEEIENLFKGLNLKSYGVMTEQEFISFIAQIKATSLGKLKVEVHGKKGSQDDTQSWWTTKITGMKNELAHCKRGFHLLSQQLKYASSRTRHILKGRPLSRYESRKVFRAVRDFLLLIPVAGIAMLPGGSLVVALVIKYFPQFLPSTFRLENMSHQRQHQVVITEVTACLEEMELRLNREKEEWTEIDTSVSKLLEFVVSSKCDSLSLEDFLHNKEHHFIEDTHLKTNGIIDRLDNTWLLLLCQNSMSTSGSGRHDPKTIANSPHPILRSLLRRRMKKIVHNNKITNSNTEKVLQEQALLEQAQLQSDSGALSKVLQDRMFPPSLSLAETHVWLQLEDNFLILLAYLFHLRDEYRLLLVNEDTANVKKTQPSSSSSSVHHKQEL